MGCYLGHTYANVLCKSLSISDQKVKLLKGGVSLYHHVMAHNSSTEKVADASNN